MSRKWQLLFYFIELCWCIWLVSWIWSELVENPAWYNWAGLAISVGLLSWWVWTIYRVIKPKPKELNYELEEDAEGAFWLTANGQTKSGPYTYRHEAYEQVIEDIQKEIKR
ncbi:membrane protein [Arthrobacter phage Lewando]|nr:membrane protein [Arthrobacter phage Lewando]